MLDRAREPAAPPAGGVTGGAETRPRDVCSVVRRAAAARGRARGPGAVALAGPARPGGPRRSAARAARSHRPWAAGWGERWERKRVWARRASTGSALGAGGGRACCRPDFCILGPEAWKSRPPLRGRRARPSSSRQPFSWEHWGTQASERKQILGLLGSGNARGKTPGSRPRSWMW